jgi:hypothetical protein
MKTRILVVSAAAVALSLGLYAQFPGGLPAAPAKPGRPGAPIDLTGTWVSLVTEDWLYRMVTPEKGDFASLPANAEGRKVGNAWDPAKDEAAGEACKSYGVAAIMRVPGRLRISWQEDLTLKIETDAGTQTRLLRFGNPQPPTGDAGWQGFSVATWELAGGRGPGAGFGGDNAVKGGPQRPRGGSLKVVTTRMRAGYLRKNGYPYSANAMVTEYFDRLQEPNGDVLLIVKTIVDDPQYLQQPFITSTHFKKIPDNQGWNPTPCSAR